MTDEQPQPPEQRMGRESTTRALVELLTQTGLSLMDAGRISGMEIYREHDVHAFFRSQTDPSKVIHVQAYPGFSDDTRACFGASEMDYQNLMEIRAQAQQNGGPSIGNEHEAVRRQLVRQTNVPMRPEAVAGLFQFDLPDPQDQSGSMPH